MNSTRVCWMSRKGDGPGTVVMGQMPHKYKKSFIRQNVLAVLDK